MLPETNLTDFPIKLWGLWTRPPSDATASKGSAASSTHLVLLLHTEELHPFAFTEAPGNARWPPSAPLLCYRSCALQCPDTCQQSKLSITSRFTSSQSCPWLGHKPQHTLYLKGSACKFSTGLHCTTHLFHKTRELFPCFTYNSLNFPNMGYVAWQASPTYSRAGYEITLQHTIKDFIRVWKKKKRIWRHN